MNIAVIACIKKEERYISEWIEWHLSIGIDHFFLADNNDYGYSPSLSSVLQEYTNSGVVDIFPYHDIKPIQPKAYDEIYAEHGNEYDWFLIIDCDEFLHLPKFNNDIKAFFSEKKFNDADIVYFHWRYYDDNGLVEYDNRPVQERFVHPVERYGGVTFYIKSALRNKSHMEKVVGGTFHITSQHSIITDQNKYPQVVRMDCFGNKLKETWRLAKIPCNPKEYEYAYIRHFMTKTIDEYVGNKKQRGGAQQKSQGDYSRYSIKRFFDYNDITSEKIIFLKDKYGIDYVPHISQDSTELKQLNFCYMVDANEIQRKMMCNSIQSLIHCYGHYNIHIYIISLDSCNDKDKEKMIKGIEVICKNTPFDIIHFNPNICAIFKFPRRANNKSYLGYNSLSRFFIPYIIDCSDFYYVDNDILFVKDVYRKLSVVNKNTFIRVWNIHRKAEYDKLDHLNAGIMYINKEMWVKDEALFSDILNYYRDNSFRIRYMNQSCYEWIIKERCKNKCVVENDININNTNIYKDVEIFHGAGKDKDYYFEQYKKYKELLK